MKKINNTNTELLIVDDHAIVREGLKRIINEQPNLTVKHEAQTGESALEKIKSNHYDMIVLDISLPGKSGYQVLKEVKAIKPELPVLILSMHNNDHYVNKMFQAGASGYLTKDDAPEKIVEAIQLVKSGKRYTNGLSAEVLGGTLKDQNN